MQEGWSPAKRAPGKKNTKKWCRGKEGVEHVLSIKMDSYFSSVKYQCDWKKWWDYRNHIWHEEDLKYRCYHVEYCINCGKIFRTQLEPEECPNYHEHP